MRSGILALLLLLTGCSRPDAPQPASLTIETEIDTTAGFVGDVFHYRIRIDGLGDKYVMGKEFFPPGGERRSQQDYREKDSQVYQFEIVYWDTGQQVIPPQEFKVYNADSTLYGTFKTDPVFLTIGSLLRQDPSSTLKPLKPPVPLSGKADLKRLIAGLVLLLLLAGIYWIWKQREGARQEAAIRKQFIPPHRKALDLLAALKKNPNQDVKEWYTSLSHILREYVEYRFYIRALEMTTDEIKQHQSLLPVEETLKRDFIRLLRKADQVKYARAIPDIQQMEADINFGLTFVRNTAPDPDGDASISSDL